MSSPSNGTPQKHNLNSISLFSGAMGLDIGLERAGFRTRLALEINKAAVETIRLNRPKLPVIDGSIQEVTTEDILNRAGLRKSEVALISAGPCCQSFSTAGKRGSVLDERGNLFRDFCRVVREIRPRFFVMENVKGILSAAIKHRTLDERGAGFPPLQKEEQFGSALRLILDELASLKYYTVYGLLNAADFGVPQKRWRVFFLGSRDGEDISLPTPTHCDPQKLESQRMLFPRNLRSWVTLRTALADVPAEHWQNFSSDRLALLQKIKQGQNWRDLPQSLRRRALGAALDSWGGRSGFCRRLSWDEPSPTLTTDPAGRATTLCHPVADRPLSIEEYAKLQEFPTEWVIGGSLNQQYTQVGNAVPVGLGYAVGRALRRAIKSTSRHPLSSKNYRRRGIVECGDPDLRERLTRRRKTQLHPRRLRKNPDTEAAKKWLRASA
jgi:DNA (cytosine-5)-methyltransferase 1